jgi:hypothetical protein
MAQEEDQAAIFGRSWIAANIFPGPHSMTDRPIVQDIVDQFIGEARDAGVSQEQLELSLGDIRVFLQKAFDDAQRAWSQARR